MSASRYVHLNVETVLRVTDAALLLRLAESGEEVWIPLSQISDGEQYQPGGCDLTISITEWIAEQKGLG